MNDVLQAIVIGIPQGALYGLMGFGIAMIFRATHTINFSHGFSAMFGVLISLSVYNVLMPLLGGSALLSLLLAVIVGLAASALLGVLTDSVLMRKIKNISPGSMLMVTLGMMMVYEALAHMIWHPDFWPFPSFVSAPPIILGSQEYVEGAFRLIISVNDIAVVLIALVFGFGVAVFMKYTSMGLAIRARGQDRVGAQVVGINTDMVDRIVWGVALALATLVGVLVAPETTVHTHMLMNPQLYGITAAVIGGFSSMFGALWGGLIIGITERLVGIFPVMEGYETAVIFFLVILMLVFKPEGLFGTRKGRKA